MVSFFEICFLKWSWLISWVRKIWKWYVGKKCECLQLSRINWILYAKNLFPFKHSGIFTKYKFLSFFVLINCISMYFFKICWVFFCFLYFFFYNSFWEVQDARMLYWSTHSVRPYRKVQTSILANPVCKRVHLLHLPSNRVK